MQVAEIAVRFGDTTLDVAHVSSGTYRIGTGADVDLAVAGLTSFPLIDWSNRGCMLRIPAGVVARQCDGTPLSGSLLLGRDDEIELAIDRLAIRVSLIARAAPLARPRLDVRWTAWIAGALAVHLFALGFVHAFATPEPEGVRVASIMSLIPRPPDPELPSLPVRVVRKRDQKRVAVQAVAVVEPKRSEPQPQSEPARRDRAVAGARRAGMLGSLRAEDIKAITGSVDLDKALSQVGPVYREHEAEAKGFGGGRRWDPSKDRRFDSIATGRYETVANGRAAGEYYKLPGEVGGYVPPRIEHCTGACKAAGGLSRDTVQTVLARHNQAILDCYDRHGAKKRGSVSFEFEIKPDGKVATAHGEGLGRTGGCVASAVRRMAFPTAETTTATYSVSFAP